MMRPFLLLIPLLALVAGCQGGSDEPTPKPAASAGGALKEAAKRANGDWTKLTPEEQKKFLDRTRGHEAAAQAMVSSMATTP